LKRRIVPRCLALLGLTLLVALLGGCTERMGFLVRNDYPFAVSITDAHEGYGTVPPGRQMRMPFGLSHYGPARLEVRDPQGRVVRRVWISQSQFDRVRMALKGHVAAVPLAVSLAVGPKSVSVGGVEDRRRAADNRRSAAVVLITPLAVYMGLVCWWLVAYLGARRARRVR